MLASPDFRDGKDYTEYLIEEKYDGVRCLVMVDEAGNISLWGRSGKRFTNLEAAFKVSHTLQPQSVYDVELMGDTFYQLMGHLNTKAPAPPDAFYVVQLDCIQWNGTYIGNVPYMHRRSFHHHTFKKSRVLSRVATAVAIQRSLAFILNLGGEGLVIKRRDSLYHPGKRSRDWLKVLPYREMDVEVIGFETGEGKRKGSLGRLKVQTTDCPIAKKVVFYVGVFQKPEGELQQMYHDLCSGAQPVPCTAKISFKELIGHTGIPRQPVFLNYKEEPPNDLEV